MTQSEQTLEYNLIKRLTGLGYERVTICNEKDLYANLRAQLQKHNWEALEEKPFSDLEFEKILIDLDKGGVFERAQRLRGKYHLARDDGSSAYIEFMNTEHWCQNEYQVTSQVTVEGDYKNRYDVTLLINGLPLVQIELKRRGLELKEAFNQVNRYQRHSYWASNGLFQYVQLFVISNGVNTKYYANNRKQSFKQTFFWADKENNLVTQLDPFADQFLEKCHVSKMIAKYTVLHQGHKILMVLRPYQYHAVEAMIDRVKATDKNGYIWHTTGSGKTLTSFKAAQVIKDLPKVEKVLFVVDRADLDYQTTEEFNALSDGSVDGTDNTKKLVKQLGDDTGLIVTTIQKLNTAISKAKYDGKINHLADKKVVFIFDECHRSQFGDTHDRIKAFFNKAQMFGFTGTPIFIKNSVRNQLGKRTTADLFDKRLHSYVITNAISDENVLRFSIEYWGKLKRKDGSLIDEEVAGINTKEFFEDEGRIKNIIDWMIVNHDRKTHNRMFSSILCVGSVDALIKYYDIFKAKREAGEHNLRIATIFSYGTNEEDAEADGMIGEEVLEPSMSSSRSMHSRERLDSYIDDYNAMFGTGFSTKQQGGFYAYYKNISKRLKDREKVDFDDKNRVDILLVVNMYLTGFDAKMVNTLYVDKNLKYHGLIQAFSRTNRTLNEVKSHGNVVCFRNLKAKTDEAITLFSDTNPNEHVLMDDYEVYIDDFNQKLRDMLAIAPTVNSVTNLESEEEELAFVQAFRALIRLKNILGGFSQFTFDDLGISKQDFEDYTSKYLDIRDKVKSEVEGDSTSILDDIDFELELLHRDEINVAYILQLLADIHNQDETANPSGDTPEQKKQVISNILDSEPKLRSKKRLIEKFINENMPQMEKNADVKAAFGEYWTKERQDAFQTMCKEEGLEPSKVEAMVEAYRFSGLTPLRDDILNALEDKPKIRERKSVVERVKDKILDLIMVYDDDRGDF